MTVPGASGGVPPVVGRAWTSTRTAWMPSLCCAATSLLSALMIARANGITARDSCSLAAIVGVLVGMGAVLGSLVIVTMNAREVSWRHGLGHVRHVSWAAVRHADQLRAGCWPWWASDWEGIDSSPAASWAPARCCISNSPQGSTSG